MTLADYIIILIYGAGILFIGSLLAKRNQTAVDMFAVRKQSPWWLSGLSSFMSAFSAGTFVVWGGIAYKQGMVAVSILMCSGIASFLVGRLFATKWASLNISTVGEFVHMRFGQAAVQFYTWIGMLFKIVAMAVALYAFAVVVSPLVKLSPDNWLADPTTHQLSVKVTIVLSGVLMLMYAVSGGLWAVLIIDAIQFVVLTMTVLFVVPMCLYKIGGPSELVHALPSSFFSPIAGKFSWLFLLGWIVVHTFKLGGEWVFIQRFLAVKNAKEARKSSKLFGWLYIISPIIWMLPPIIYRAGHPGAPPEQAYILACAWVLPPGMIGLLIAAMFSSAASYIDGEVNVYASAVTSDVYHRYMKPQATNKELLFVGRISSIFIGAIIIVMAIFIPNFGGAEQVIMTITGLLVVAMVLPVLWGLYFGGIKQSAIWVSTGGSVLVAAILKLGIPKESTSSLFNYYHKNEQMIDLAAGIFVPLLLLILCEFLAKQPSPGFLEVKKLLDAEAKSEGKNIENDHSHTIFPARLLSYSMIVLAIIMLGLLFFSSSDSRVLISMFALILIFISFTIYYFTSRLTVK